MRKIYKILLFLFCLNLQAQEFYISDVQYASISRIKYVDSNFNVTTIAQVDQNAGIIIDIALDSSGRMFAVTSLDIIVEIFLPSGAFSILAQLPEEGYYNNLAYNNINNELVTLDFNSGILYMVNVETGQIGVPIPVGLGTPGDLTYYKGNLIFQDVFSSDIFSFNGNTLKKIACCEILNFFGFSNFTTSCNINLIYGFREYGDIYSFNIETNSNTYVTNIGSDIYTVTGAATVNEYLASTCPLEELTEVNCNLSTAEILISNIQLYPNPINNILYIQDLNFTEDLFYTLYSIEGKVLSEDILSPKIDLSQLSSGVYLMNIYNKSKSAATTKKIVKN